MSKRVLLIFAFLLAAPAAAQSVSPATTQPVALQQPVPSLVAQTSAREMIRKLYKNDYDKKSPADRQALAKLLVAQAKETNDDAAARYVALMEAADLAAGAGDATTAISAIDEIARNYSTNALDLQRQALVKAHAAATTPEQSDAVMRFALDAADRAAAVDAFDSVQQLATLAEAAANKTRLVHTVSSIQVHLGALHDLTAEFAQVKAAFARLDKNAMDADAHLVVGHFYALSKGQWSLGLPHLAQGSDEKLRELASKELAHPEDGLAQAALGDAWWELAEKSTGMVRTNVTAHATEWYKTAQGTIQGITLARIQSRIQSGTAQSSTPATPAPPAAPTVGTRIDLLALLDTSKDVAQGRWSRTAAGVSCDSSAYAAMHLPYTTAEEFDLRTTFTRTDGEGPIAILLATHNRAFGFALDVKGEARFERVESKIAKDNPTVVPVALSNNRRYTLTIEVRKDRVRALLDDKLLTEWKTDYKDLSHYAAWKLSDNGLSAIGANGAKVTFHAVDLIEITGKGKPTR